MDIRCKKINCKYNNCYSCQARGILIEAGLECAMFEPSKEVEQRNKEKIKNSKTEFAGEIAPYKPNKSRKIECKAKCLFNESGKCKANGITVLPEGDSPECVTHINK